MDCGHSNHSRPGSLYPHTQVILTLHGPNLKGLTSNPPWVSFSFVPTCSSK